MHVLRAQLEVQAIGLDQRLDRSQRREGRADDDLDLLGVVAIDQVRELLHRLDRLEVRLVHLPVCGDDRLAGHLVLQDRHARQQ